jgi:hydroxymethylglutaryl-CoA lyase
MRESEHTWGTFRHQGLGRESTRVPILTRLPERVRVVEVGPRDGLQNEPVHVASHKKIAFIDALSRAGFRMIEATSFVSPRAVPQMADAAEVVQGIDRTADICYPVLVPNERGYDRALEAGCSAIALFTAASPEFSKRNVNATIEETFVRFAPIARRARQDDVWIRGYVSTATDCPYKGEVEPAAAVDVAERLFDLGCAEVALADTIGHATPKRIGALLDQACVRLPADRLALHLHDTGGLAIANVMIGLDYGITTFDAAAGGLGGCPFAPGAPGNLATERLLKLLHGLGIETGVDESRVIEAIEELRSDYPTLGCRDAA